MSDRIGPSLRDQIARCQLPKTRAAQVVEFLLPTWKSSEIEAVLAQVEPPKSKAGSSDPCGPSFNRKGNMSLIQRLLIYTTKSTGIAMLIPVQLCAAIYLGIWRRNWKAIVYEIPRPSVSIARGLSNIFTYIKAPQHLIQTSIERKQALCVNRNGKFKLIGPNDPHRYAVLSYVWGNVMAWQTPNQWGAVDLALRREGIVLEHLQRLFDVCCESESSTGLDSASWESQFIRTHDYDWMWLDVIAMPEVLEDMSSEEMVETEKLRAGVINTFSSIYRCAGRITVLDNVVRRLRSSSMVDVAVTLCFGWWMTRLWTLVESRLAQKVLIRTADAVFDLDEIISFLVGTINNDQHRYWGILSTLIYLRPAPQGWEKLLCSTAASAEKVKDGRNLHILEYILSATSYRSTHIRVDNVRILFPLTCLSWDSSWKVEDGFQHLYGAFPEYHQLISEYYENRKDAIEKQGTVLGKIWDNDVVMRSLEEAF